MIIFSTERTRVSPITLDDAPFFLRLVNTEGWLEFIGERNVNTIAEAEDCLASGFLDSYQVHGFSYYLVQVDAGPIGVSGFLNKPHYLGAITHSTE